MKHSDLYLYNSLTRKKETFEPIREGFVGFYVCGPTVYNDVHLGNCRTFVSFDVIYRYLLYKGYKVRYVRNITDVGHLEGDADVGAEDKISKTARIEQLEPREISQKYENRFHDMMRIFNTLPPSIEPRATGHIIEQINMVKRIIENGYGYVVNGSVYFDTPRFVEDYNVYGNLSGRIVDELLSGSRDDLKHQEEKRNPADFAIWIKADPTHLMHWESPWSEGFPGWHMECSAMSTKYLGEQFDIHGGGGDLKFPHHENEIAQNYGACSCGPANYWLHGNMLLLEGKKMSKSEGNTIEPRELFTGNTPHLSKGYDPMVVRFFMLQSHYRSTLDITDESLRAAEKGYMRLMQALHHLDELEDAASGQEDEADEKLLNLVKLAYSEMDDDFNTPRALARLFELAHEINAYKDGHKDINTLHPDTIARAKEQVHKLVFDIFGLQDITRDQSRDAGLLDELMQLILEVRDQARENKDWNTADKIRDTLQAMKIEIKDGKDGTEWNVKA